MKRYDRMVLVATLWVALGTAAAGAQSPPRTRAGQARMHASARRAARRVIARRAPSGPDQFGYTWDDSVPFAWIDATDGTLLDMTSCWYSGLVQLQVSFPFHYYGKLITDFLVNYNGFLLMRTAGGGWSCFPNRIPRIGYRNSIVAPYFGYFAKGSGAVYSKTGGTAPDRWMVIEWIGMHTDGDPTDSFTFEVVLHEGGDITFQYQNMSYGAATHRSVTGIEDSTGYRGLCYQYLGQVASGIAIRFTNPAPAAHAFIYPPLFGGLYPMNWPSDRYPGPDILNDGELGDDTFDLTASSGWDLSMNGSDTNGNGIVDTGVLHRGWTTVVHFGLEIPPTLGASNTAVLTATSSVDPSSSASAKFQTAVPARFAVTWLSSSGETYQLHYGPWEAHGLSWPDGFYTAPATVETKSGHFVQARYAMEYGHEWYHVLGMTFDRNDSLLTDNFVIDVGADAYCVTDLGMAVAPNGRIGVVWTRCLVDNDKDNNENDNVYFAVIDEDGDILVQPTNVTNNAAFGKLGDSGVPFISYAKIAATGNSRFVFAWQEQSQQVGGAEQNVYTAVYDSAGSQVQGVVNRSGVAAGAGTAGCPGVGEMSDGRVALAYSTTASGQIEVHALDGDGNDVASTPLGVDGCSLDLVDLAQDRLMVGYIDSGVTGFAVLGPDLSLVAPATPLPNASARNDSVNLSVTRDARGNGILTWEEEQAYDLLNYAYVSSAGTVVTPATVSYPWYPYPISDTGFTISGTGYGVTTTRPFADVPVRSFAAGYIERLLDDGIATGCGEDVFCPDDPVVREQMALFLLKAKHGRDYQPPACSGVFADVPCPSQYADWIEQLAAEVIMAGCGNGNYCPSDPVTREQMALFLLATEHGEGYRPPACTRVFGDVPCLGRYADWIEQLAAEGIMAGCGDGNFCPSDPVTRAQMAVFLVETFGLP